jgi:hypothetical protein
MNCLGTVKINLYGMLMDFGKTIKLKWGAINARVRSNVTAMVWKEKCKYC